MALPQPSTRRHDDPEAQSKDEKRKVILDELGRLEVGDAVAAVVRSANQHDIVIDTYFLGFTPDGMVKTLLIEGTSENPAIEVRIADPLNVFITGEHKKKDSLFDRVESLDESHAGNWAGHTDGRRYLQCVTATEENLQYQDTEPKTQADDYPSIRTMPHEEDNLEWFAIDSTEKAAWATRKIAELMSKLEENRALAGREIAHVMDWLESVNKSHREPVKFLIKLLNEYYSKETFEDKELKRVAKVSNNTIQVKF